MKRYTCTNACIVMCQTVGPIELVNHGFSLCSVDVGTSIVYCWWWDLFASSSELKYTLGTNYNHHVTACSERCTERKVSVHPSHLWRL